MASSAKFQQSDVTTDSQGNRTGVIAVREAPFGILLTCLAPGILTGILGASGLGKTRGPSQPLIFPELIFLSSQSVQRYFLQLSAKDQQHSFRV